MLPRWLAGALGHLRTGQAGLVPLTADERKALLREIDQSLLANDNFDEARVNAARLLQADPRDPTALAMAGFVAFLSDSYAEALPLLEKAVELDPSNGRAIKFLAATLLKLGNDHRALHFAEQAAGVLPHDCQVMNVLGVLYLNMEHYDKSADMFHKALETAPNDLTPLTNLAVLEAKSRSIRRVDDSRPRTEHIKKQALNRLLAAHRRSKLEAKDVKPLLALTSTSPAHFEIARNLTDDLYSRQAYEDPEVATIMGNVYSIVGEVHKSVEMREYAVSRKPHENGPKLVLAQTQIAAGDHRWPSAWKLYNDEIPKIKQSVYVTGLPQWDGGRLGNGRLFVFQDQGIGDVLLCLRLIPLLAAKKIRVVLWVTQDIGELARNVTGYEEFISSKIRPDPKQLDCVAAAPLFGLISILQLQPRNLKTPTMIHPPPTLCAEWRERLKPKERVRIGLVMCGNPWRYDDWMRSISPADLAPLRECKEIEWVNLAVDRRPELTEAITQLEMVDLTKEFRDFTDTAAVIDSLDAVVAIDCSVAHLAAAMGKRVWVLAPSFIDWRWQIGGDTQPWWPTTTVLRSKKPGQWKEPVAQLVKELQMFAAEFKEVKGRVLN